MLEEGDLTEEALESWDKDLSKYIGELIEKEGLTYLDLNIEDNSRKMGLPANKYEITSLETYGYQVSMASYSHIVLCGEKDTVFDVLNDIAGLLGCSCLSGKGQSARSAVEKMLRKMDIKKDIYLLTMTDYDPAGYDIASTFKAQMELLLPILGYSANVHIERVGIRPDQLTRYEVVNNMYTPKGKDTTQGKRWLKETGGIDGEYKGLELDALSPDRIRGIFATSLKKYIDPGLYRDFVKEAFIRKRVLERLRDRVDKVVGQISAKFGDDVHVEDFDIFDMVDKQYPSIPIGSICVFGKDDDVEAAIDSCFR